MSSSTDNFDALLDDVALCVDDDFGSILDSTTEPSKPAWVEPGYEGSIDYRIRQLSYSSLLELHSCPRSFELYKKRSTARTEENLKSTITFAFGHVVGEGAQMIFEGKSEQEIIWKMFLGWHTPDLFDSDDKSKKSFWNAVIAIKKLLSLRASGFLNDYELVYHNGRPACELSFAILFPDGFRLRGFVDAVLRHKRTGKVLVLECKTTNSRELNPATYKNSAQAIGYSIVLDALYPDLSSYEVLYLVYLTGKGEWNPIPFEKTYLQRALWLRELLYDIETIKMYEAGEHYPMRGESCFKWGRECYYLETCTMSTDKITTVCTEDMEDKTEYQVVVSFNDLLEAQMRKVEV